MLWSLLKLQSKILRSLLLACQDTSFPSLGSQDRAYSTGLRLKAWCCDSSHTGPAEVSKGKNTHQPSLVKQTGTGNKEKSHTPRSIQLLKCEEMMRKCFNTNFFWIFLMLSLFKAFSKQSCFRQLSCQIMSGIRLLHLNHQLSWLVDPLYNILSLHAVTCSLNLCCRSFTKKKWPGAHLDTNMSG